MGNERTAKVVVVGDIGVGKTCFLLRFTDNKFPLSPVTTIGTDFKRRSVDVDSKKIVLEVWDTAGQERYKSLTSRFFRNSNGVILMFDVTDAKSFLGVQNWLNDLDHHGVHPSRCLLIGNKIDMANERVVDNLKAVNLAHRHGMAYMEISAKEDTNVQQAFMTIARQMIDQMKDTQSTVLDNGFAVHLTLPKNEGKKPKKSCRSCRS